MTLYKKGEALFRELGMRRDLAYCYWSWGLLARKQRDRKTERKKLSAAFDIFTELNMPRERAAMGAEVEKKRSADRANSAPRKYDLDYADLETPFTMGLRRNRGKRRAALLGAMPCPPAPSLFHG